MKYYFELYKIIFTEMKLYQIRNSMYNMKNRRIILAQNKQKYNRRNIHYINNPNNPNEPFWALLCGAISYYCYMKWYFKK